MPLLLFLMIFLLILISPSDDQAILIPLSMSLFGSLLPKCLNTWLNLNPTYHWIHHFSLHLFHCMDKSFPHINHQWSKIDILPENWLWNRKDHSAVMLLRNPIQNLKQQESWLWFFYINPWKTHLQKNIQGFSLGCDLI